MNPQNLHAHEDRLLDFAYGELPVPEARVVEAHLQGCARCTQALRDIRGVRATMSQLSQEPAPDAGLESLMAYAAQAARRAAAGPAPKPSRWRRWLLPVVGLASVTTFGILAVQAVDLSLTEPSLKEASVAQEKGVPVPPSGAVPAAVPVAPAPAAPPEPAAPKELLMAQQGTSEKDAPAQAVESGKGEGAGSQAGHAQGGLDDGSGGTMDNRPVPEAKAKQASVRGGTARARGDLGKAMTAKAPAPSKSAPARKADRDEESMALAEPVTSGAVPSKKTDFMSDKLKLGGTPPAMELAADEAEDADGLTAPAPDEELAPARAVGSVAVASGPPAAMAEPSAPMAAPATRRAEAPSKSEAELDAPAAERRASVAASVDTEAPRKKARKPESAAAMPPPSPQMAVAREPGLSVSELSRQALAAKRDGNRGLEARLLDQALKAGPSPTERWDLLNRLCDARFALEHRAAGEDACMQVLAEAPASSPAARAARSRLSREGIRQEAPAASQPAQ
ncbi:zf-HC2 domain-containing protein [Myxococcus sp. RHSTA-1-4]|uniref:zf-HC2 domain-containing protein n=1 Tax=Myxococcus sp. RHSTA-1-4 TaxID=2874601 RepID=UPI001CBB6A40|nr:zf-HC2 domain-containing protein [Myxococcus sp. RHSTA-1-4]MBZ4417731.1 zf-HC2 domain-containing protein [Myxococcus sp. RHSTA-1-4]